MSLPSSTWRTLTCSLSTTKFDGEPRKPALGAYGDGTAITPEMDRLAAMGMRFESAYSNQAVCAPSRYSLMLGSRSTSTGIYDFGRNFRDFYPHAITLPQQFMHHGYHAEAMGKVYHIGHNTYNDDAPRIGRSADA